MVSYVVALLVLVIIVLWNPHMFLNIGKNKYAALLKIKAFQTTIIGLGEGHREVRVIHRDD